jgi:hypothetical protein
MSGKFERDLASFDKLHAVINCKLQMLRNAQLRGTADADKIRQTQSQIDEYLARYAEMARELAKDASDE